MPTALRLLRANRSVQRALLVCSRHCELSGNVLLKITHQAIFTWSARITAQYCRYCLHITSKWHLRFEIPVVNERFAMYVQIDQQSLVTRQMWNMYARQRRAASEIQDDYEVIQQKLHNILEDVLPDWQIKLVGSSMNGLSTFGSDLDICLIDDYSDLTSWQIIQCLLIGLKRYGVDDRPCYIPDIPLVRFRDDTTGRQVDLGINTRNSIRNTHLIKCYTKCEYHRFPPHTA